MEVTKYKGFRVGQKVELTIDYFDDHVKIPKGTRFNIDSFPPATRPGKNLYFVYGITADNNRVRIFPENIKKV